MAAGYLSDFGTLLLFFIGGAFLLYSGFLPLKAYPAAPAQCRKAVYL